MIITKQDIDKYIELDKKIKERIVQISDVLIRVSDQAINKFVPSNKKHYSDRICTTDDEFLENSPCDDYINLAYCDEDRDLCEFNFDKDLLCVSDETLEQIKEYDAIRQQEELEKARERERIRQEKLKEDVEKQEYQQYLRLKEKFEKKEVSK